MLVFIHINKTGGRTVRYILRSSYGTSHCEVEPWHARWADPPFSNEDLRRVRKVYPNLQSIGGHRLRAYVDLEQNGNELQYMTFMRDPVKTSASHFQFSVEGRGKKGLVFEKWIEQEWLRNRQTKMIAGEADVDKAIQILQQKRIFVGMTERFDESMVLLKGLIAPNLNIAYRRVNVARSNALAQSLLSNPDTHQMLVDANQADLALYDYVKEEHFPTFQEAYGPSLEGDVARYRETQSGDFNTWNLALSRMKQYLVYKPLLALYRRGVRVVEVDG